jgi:3-deoxy-D-manno-octulosonate 8-phosphate phosphatase (KDO 8-P phosphatase)
VDRVVTPLSAVELAIRARRLRLVLSDCDGVLTDGTVYVSARGETLKRFSLRDGMGVERLREVGVETAIVTRERSPIVARRAGKLGVHLYEGVRDKRQELAGILARASTTAAQAAYIGDDVNDLGVLEEVAREGLTAAPADAQAAVVVAAHYRCRACGGAGAFREFAEWLLCLRRGPDGAHADRDATGQ